jgi:hypothetical protein
MAALTDTRKERYAQARAAAGTPGNLSPAGAIEYALPYVTSITRLNILRRRYQSDSAIIARITEIG